MRVAFHPVVDNPIRMAFVSGWKRIGDLIERLADLEGRLDWGKVIPAPWEPFHEECPSCRYAGAYAWARSQMHSPLDFAAAFAFFTGDERPPRSPRARANWLILCAKCEPSRVTQKLMIVEAVEAWEAHATDWLEQTVHACAGLGIEAPARLLRQRIDRSLITLESFVPPKDRPDEPEPFEPDDWRGRGFDKSLLELDGWRHDPGTIILPVDGLSHSLAKEILLLDLEKVVLLGRRGPVRRIEWEQVTLVHLFEGAVIFEITAEPALVIAGYKHPEAVLKTIQECYRAATERILQALVTHVIRPTP